MKQDARGDRDDGEERAELRALLRQWSVPKPPAGMEDALRREIRKRRPRPRAGVWVSLAACLALIAAWSLFAPRRQSGPPEVSTPSAVTKQIETATPRLEPAAPPSEPSRASRAAAESRLPRPRPKEPAVVVEALQAELLAEFGRRAWDTPQAAPAATISAWSGAEPPAYRGEWEEVAGEWPAVEVVAPMSRR